MTRASDSLTTSEVIRYARAVLEAVGIKDDPMLRSNFLDFAEIVKASVGLLTPKQVEAFPRFREFSESFRRLRDNFADEVAADPMCRYKPAHQVALDFHKSLALYRYFFGGNRISKTVSGDAEDYWTVTGQHPFRPRSPSPAAVFIIGTNFTQYAANVFEKKFIQGEPGNPLSPVFPVGGRWLYSYDKQRHIIYLACRECAMAGKASSCPHPKSTITLFSDTAGAGVLAGGQYALGHFDEQVREEFFVEAKQRIKTVPNSGLIITETPLFGESWWTYTQLYTIGSGPPAQNVVPGTTQPLISLHTIDQFSAGLVAPEKIAADMQTMSENQIEARIYGKHVADNKMAVFDLAVLHEMRKELKEPTCGALTTTKKLADAIRDEAPRPDRRLTLRFTPLETGNLYLYERPRASGVYIIGADVAQGLTKNDASAAHVLKVTMKGSEISFQQVAVYHGWVNSLTYAEELWKLGHWYNDAVLVVESNGPGDAVIQRLKELGCWFLFRDVADPASALYSIDARFGIDTNIRTKGLMISMLQAAIASWRLGRRRVVIPHKKTIVELETYIQEPTPQGLNFRFHAAGASHDDLVMALALAVYVGTTYPVFDLARIQSENVHEGDLTPREQEVWRSFEQAQQEEAWE